MSDVDDLLVDLPGNDRKKKQKQRREIRLGYDDDSDNEVEDNTIKDLDKKKEEDEDEDDDMFASDDDKEEDKEGDQKQIVVSNVLDMDEFERAEGIEVAEIDSDDEADKDLSEDDIEYYNNPEESTNKLKREPKLEAFNLREEADQGTFDLDGNYTRNPEQGQEGDSNEDQWIEGTKKEDILRAKKSQQDRERLAREKRSNRQISAKSTEELVRRIIEVLEPAETPLEALARLTPRKKKNRNRKVEEENPYKEIILEITEVCQELVNQKAISDAYELEREEFMRLYKTETGEDFKSITRKRAREEDDDVEDPKEII